MAARARLRFTASTSATPARPIASSAWRWLTPLVAAQVRALRWPVGPKEARLQSIALVRALAFGGYGEASQDVHQLVGALAEAGAARLGVQLRVPRDQARAHLRQILVRVPPSSRASGLAQQRLQRLMFAAPAVE